MLFRSNDTATTEIYTVTNTLSLHYALPISLFQTQQYGRAADEFSVLTDLEPVNHYAQFCLGRSLQLCGRHREARPPLTMAALLQPQRVDYRVYRDRTVAALGDETA